MKRPLPIQWERPFHKSLFSKQKNLSIILVNRHRVWLTILCRPDRFVLILDLFDAAVCTVLPDPDHALVFAGISVIVTARVDLVLREFQRLHQVLSPLGQETRKLFSNFRLGHFPRNSLRDDEAEFFFFHAPLSFFEIIHFSGH